MCFKTVGDNRFKRTIIPWVVFHNIQPNPKQNVQKLVTHEFHELENVVSASFRVNGLDLAFKQTISTQDKYD